jgi:alpha-1,3-mannosyltransferase
MRGSFITHATRRRPHVIAAVISFLLLLVFIATVPRNDWPGWLPREAPREPTIEGWGDEAYAQHHGHGHHGHGHAHEVREAAALAEVEAEFTRTWVRHSRTDTPQPVYAAPQLTQAQRKRYAHLARLDSALPRGNPAFGKGAGPAKYMFVAVLKDVGPHLADMLNALAVVTSFLGPAHVSVSLVEGPSGDATPYVLRNVLAPMLLRLGVPRSTLRIETDLARIDFSKQNRIGALAELRNRALRPLWDDTGAESESTVGADVSAVVYFNDVFLHAGDILELLHQHVTASTNGKTTGITAAWDWMQRHPAHFYDVWVARTMEGELFYPIPNPWWSPSDDVLAGSAAKVKYDHLEPFQAFSAWNGMVVLHPEPLVAGIRFRRGNAAKGECAASECSLLASDYWAKGFGRVQVVPSVQLAYERWVAIDSARELRKRMLHLGWTDGVPPAQHDKPVVFDSEYVQTTPIR